MKLSSVVAELNKLWPIDHKEDWDVVGLVTGSSSQDVSKIMLTVDVTEAVVDEAISRKVDLIIAHHPLLLKAVNSIAEETAKGALLAKLIRSNIALFAAHTNADVQPDGTSAALAKALGITDSVPLAPTEAGLGVGLVGSITKLTLGQLAGYLNSVLPQTATGVRVAGDFNQAVSKVALCAGAGDAYLQLALDSGADVYITSDLRHHPAQEILEQAKARGIDFALIDISHWAAEFLWLETAKQQLSALAINTEICEIRTDVFDFLMNIPKDDHAAR